MDNGDYKKYKSDHSGLTFFKVTPQGADFFPEELTNLEWTVLWVAFVLASYAVFRIVRKAFLKNKKKDFDA